MTTPAKPTSPMTPSSIGLRQSNVTAATAVVAEADGDTWQEKIAVCESSTADGDPRLRLRSYYRNNRTGERVWDEPPSGASRILYATAEMRRMAQLQLEELQSTLEMIPPDVDAREQHLSPLSNGDNQGKAKKGFLGGIFRKNKKDTKYVEPSKDLNLQRAIARSMMDQGGRSSSNEHNESRVHLDLSLFREDADADLELAKALSLSVLDSSCVSSQHAQCSYPNDVSEEEILRQVIESSQNDQRKAK